MRSGFLALCGLLLASGPLPAQTSPTPVITSQPVGVAAHVGDTVTLSAGADGDAPLSFQWYKDGTSVAGATTTAYTINAAALTDTGVYHFVASNPNGTATTLPVTIWITKQPQTITLIPAAGNVVAGSSITLNATSTSNLPVTLALVSGSASLNGNLLTGVSGNVTVRATQAGDATFDAATPIDRTYNFVSGALSPFISSPPVDQTVTAGTTATLRGAAVGSPAPTYQWQKDGAALPGATTSTLTLPATTLADAGRYTLLATNTAGTASATATLVVRAAPVITAGPESRAIFAGEAASFNVTVTGVPAPTFQWRRNGTNLAGATAATYTLPVANTTDAGRYDVVVTNALGTVTSAAATLAVTARDFSGTYFGRFAGVDGEFALHVRPDRTAALLAQLPALQSGLAVTALRVELNGTFASTTNTLASAPDLSFAATTPPLAAAPQAVTIRGTIDDISGTVSGTIAELGATFTGTRAGRSGPYASSAGFYPAALIGSATARGFTILAADGQVMVLTASGTTLDGARGTLNDSGHFIATTRAQAALDLSFANGLLTGTMRSGTTTGTIAGAVDTRLGSERIINLSVRAITSPGPASLLAGFVIAGSGSRQVLIRSAGPALGQAPFNVPGTLNDPTLQLFRGSTQIAQNDDWGAPAAAGATITGATTRVGAFPFRAGSNDAALLTTLAPNAYSIDAGGGTGTVLAEIYEVLDATEVPGARRLINVSARGFVSPTTPFIVGFVLGGVGPQRVLIRGIGPTIGAAPFNVAGALPNPQITLYRGATAVKANDDWFRDPEATAIRDATAKAGGFALGATSADAAMLTFLEPGAYTVLINGPANANANNSSGLVLVEVYEASP